MLARTWLTIILSLTWLLFAPNASDAQWTQVRDFGPVSFEGLIFLEQFGHPEIGFLTFHPACDIYDTLYRTSDGGRTWTKIALPEQMWSRPDIQFVDADTGFVSAFDWAQNHHYLLRTTTGGVSWHRLSNTTGLRLGYTDGNFYLYDPYKNTPNIMRSRDKGATWDTLPYKGLDAAFSSTHSGLLFGHDGFIHRSIDRGASWSKTSEPSGLGSNFNILTGIPGTNTFLLSTPNGPLRRTTDVGTTWSTVNGVAGKLHGGLAATSRLQVAGGWRGISFSSDQGVSWNDLCGPTAVRLVAVVGDTVFAADGEGKLWVNRNKTSSIVTQRLIGSCGYWARPSCADTFHIDILNPNACSQTVLESISWSPTKNFYDFSAPKVPMTLSDVLRLDFHFDSHEDGSPADSAIFKIGYRVNGTRYDTTMIVRGQRQNRYSARLSGSSHKMRYLCVPDTMETRLYNNCAPVFLDSLWTVPSSGIRVLTKTKVNLATEQQLGVVTVVDPTLLNVQQYTLYAKLIGRNDTMIISTVNKCKLGKLTVFREIATDTIRVGCVKQHGQVMLENRNCDTIVIEKAWVAYTSKVALAGPFTAITIPPGGKSYIDVLVDASVADKIATGIGLTTRMNTILQTDTLGFFVVVSNTAPKWSLPLREIDFHGSCKVRDTSLTYVNESCDQLQFKSFIQRVSPTGWSTISVTPSVVAPGESFTLLIRPLTAVPGGYLDSARLIWQTSKGLDSFSVRIRLNVNAGSGTALDFPAVIQLGTRTACSTSDTTIAITNRGCEDVTIAKFSLGPNLAATSVRPTPFILASGQTELVILHSTYTAPGIYAERLKIEVGPDLSQTLFSIDLDGAIEGTPRLAFEDTLHFDTTSTCTSTLDSTLAESKSCYPVTIDAVQINDPEFTLISPSLPITIPANGKQQFVYEFKPTGPISSLRGATATLRLRSGAPSAERVISLAGYARAELSLRLSADFLDIISNSCEDLDTSLSIYNNGCEALMIDSMQSPFLVGSGAVSISAGSAGVVPLRVPRSVDTTATVVFFLGEQRIEAQLRVRCTGGMQELSLVNPLRDTTLSICDELAIPFALRNAGCLPIPLSQIECYVQSANGERIPATTNDARTQLERDEQVQFTVKLQDLPAETLRFYPRFSINGSIDSSEPGFIVTVIDDRKPAGIDLRLANGTGTAMSVQSGESVELELVNSYPIVPSHVPARQSFRVNYDDDVLSIADVTEQPGWVLSVIDRDATGATIEATPNASATITAGTAFGGLSMRTFLSARKTSSISLSDLRFENGGGSGFCPLLPQPSPTMLTVNVNEDCREENMVAVLSDRPIEIKWVESDKLGVKVNLRSAIAVDGGWEILDLLGMTLCAGSARLERGENLLGLQICGSGFRILRLQAGGHTISKRFIAH